MKKTLLASFLTFGIAAGFCSPLTPEEALSRALDSGMQQLKGKKLPADYILDWAGPEKGLYLFGNRTGGFIVTAGDDNYPALIGYSDGVLSANSVSPSMKHFLEALDAQIAAGINPEKAPVSNRENIAPLVKSLWNQSAPYNGMTPEIDGEHALTGCMATAMAEIMNYWKYPAAGEGTSSYAWNGQTLSFDFAENPFDWENMLDVYGDNATKDECDAVAKLMLACGMAAQMSYSATFSGATDTDGALGLTDYLGYDKGLAVEYRDFYRVGPWTDMLYNELKAGRPILYCGFSSAGGHAFVCDGYSNENGADYFHINWGWSGEGNGYFLINLLNPSYIGLGASATGFNTMQSAMLGIMPAGETPSERPAPNLVCFGYFATDGFNFKPGDTIMFGPAGGIMRMGFYNMSLYPVDIVSGISLTDQTSGEVSYYEGSISTTLKPSYGIETYKVNTTGIPAGVYRVHPAFKVDDKWIELPEEVGMHTKMIMTVTDSAITIETTEDSSAIFLMQVGLVSPVITIGEPFYIEAEVESVDYEEPMQITPILIKNNYIYSLAETKNVQVDPGKTAELQWNAVFDPVPEPGLYKMALITEKSTLMMNPIDVVVVEEGSESKVKLTNVRINRRLISTSKVASVSGQEMNVTFTFNCIGGWFNGTVEARIMYEGETVLQSEKDECTVLQGQSSNGTYSFNITELDPAATYELCFFANEGGEERQIGDPYQFTAPDASAVEMISGENVPAEYFSVDGRKVTGSTANGIYIKRQNGKTEKIIR